MTSTNIVIMVTIIAYLALVVLIGLNCSRQNKDTDDFFLGGRKLGPFVTAMSAEASDMSSWLLLGLPGVAYLAGLAEASWTSIGLAVGTYLNWLIVAKRIRAYSIKVNAITVPEFFSARYRDSKKILQLVAAIIIIIFFVPYTASGFSACGKLFTSLFGIDYHVAMILSALVIMVYTTLGGFLAASTTDFVQSIIMTIAIITVFGFGVSVAGGWGAVMDNAKALPGYLELFNTYSVADKASIPYTPLSIASTFAWGLGYFGMPHILLRFMAARKAEEIKLSRRIASVWVVISMAVAIFIGVIGLGVSKVGAIETLEGNNSETVLVKITQLLASKGWLCAIVGGIILAGVLAATMSTADSQLLAAASSVTEDILTKKFGVKFAEKTQMLVARLSVVFISILGIFLAWNPDSSVFRIVSFAWAGFGATFGPVVLLALFWKRSNLQGSVAGMIAGAIMVFVWKFGISKLGGAFAIYELLPAFVVAIVVNVIVSLLTKAPEQEIVDEFEAVKAELKK